MVSLCTCAFQVGMFSPPAKSGEGRQYQVQIDFSESDEEDRADDLHPNAEENASSVVMDEEMTVEEGAGKTTIGPGPAGSRNVVAGGTRMADASCNNKPVHDARSSKTKKNTVNPSSSPGLASLGAPSTASAPITSHIDALIECLDALRRMQREELVTKQDVIESLHSMLSSMLSSVLMHNFSTSMSVKGWRVE